jgi:hypothetical protein
LSKIDGPARFQGVDPQKRAGVVPLAAEIGLLDTGIADASGVSAWKGRIVLTLWRRKSGNRRDCCAGSASPAICAPQLRMGEDCERESNP